MGYKFLEHTADVQAECRAVSFTGLLETAAQALYSIALKKQRKLTRKKHELFVSGAGREEVLVRWLQELVFLLETDGFAAVKFHWDGSHVEEQEHPATGEAKAVLTVHCTAEGYICRPEDRGEEIKGATYHGLTVEKKEQAYMARVIFDL